MLPDLPGSFPTAGGGRVYPVAGKVSLRAYPIQDPDLLADAPAAYLLVWREHDRTGAIELTPHVERIAEAIYAYRAAMAPARDGTEPVPRADIQPPYNREAADQIRPPGVFLRIRDGVAVVPHFTRPILKLLPPDVDTPSEPA